MFIFSLVTGLPFGKTFYIGLRKEEGVWKWVVDDSTDLTPMYAFSYENFYTI